MSTILVVDDMALCREPIADALRHHGHDVTCANGGAEALDILREQKPDLVLLDVTMPDPDGMAVLKIMRRNPDLKEIPVILLTDRAEQGTVCQAAKCGVQGYLLKAKFSLDVLLSRISVCVDKANPDRVATRDQGNRKPTGTSSANRAAATLTASRGKAVRREHIVLDSSHTETESASMDSSIELLHGLEPIITKAKLSKLVNDGLKLKPLAVTVHSVMAVTGNANCCAADVAKIVGNDQALSIRLLKLANSSAYSRGHSADSVQTAVQRIGIHEVRQLVMALGVLDHYVDSGSTRIDIRWFWEHSLACGLIAAALAKECHYKAVDECFLWGTLHDVGRLILLDQAPREYDEVCNVADELRLPLEVVERRLLLLDHSEILRHALDHWQFSNAFIAPVVDHHEPANRLQRLGPEHAQAAMIVALANRIAHALSQGCSGNETLYPFDDLVETLGVSATALDRIAATIPNETRDLKLTMLVHSASDIGPDFVEVLRTRLGTKVRPLCVSSGPSTDAFKLFLDRVGEHDEADTPNLGLIYLRDAHKAEVLFAKYERSETKFDCGVLPLIVVSEQEARDLGEAPWQTRSHVVLQTPVPIALFVESVQRLLAEVVEA